MNINITLFGQAISFTLFCWFCIKFVWPPLIGAMEERKRNVAEGLLAAERAKDDLRLAKEKMAKELKKSKEHNNELIEVTRKNADKIIFEAKREAEQQAVRILDNARVEISLEVSKARKSLQNDVAKIAVDAASKIIGQSVNSDTHSKLLADMVSKL